MNVLIKGMKMPESCSECRLFVGAWCSALDESDWRAAYNKPPDGKRLKGCPLAETAEPKTGECETCKRNADNGGFYDDGRTRCPIQEHYALLKDGYCHLYESMMRGEEE